MKISTTLPNDSPPSETFGWLFIAYTVAQADILKAKGPTAIRATSQSDVYEVEIAGQCSRAILTVALTLLPDDLLIDPVDFKVLDIRMFDTVFSYDRDQPNAFIMRMMTSWLEDIFLIHRKKIMTALRADIFPRPCVSSNRLSRLI